MSWAEWRRTEGSGGGFVPMYRPANADNGLSQLVLFVVDSPFASDILDDPPKSASRQTGAGRLGCSLTSEQGSPQRCEAIGRVCTCRMA